jgi:tubulin polyglutamylase TTLL6/13
MREQKEYSFYPRTWCLPGDFFDFKAQFDAQGKSKHIFIVKPDSGCQVRHTLRASRCAQVRVQGRGIFLTQCLYDVPAMESVVAQRYIRRPLLIEGFKFDLRVYILVASCKPLRMYMVQ